MTIGGRCKIFREFLPKELFVNQHFEPKLVLAGKISSIFFGAYLILTSIVGKDCKLISNYMKKTIRPILRDDLSRKGLEKRIDLRVYLDGRQTKFATPYSIAPACWDKKSGRVVGNCPEKSVINSYLNGKETEYERYLFQCEMLGETVDLERIREILTGKSRTAPSEKTNVTLDEIFDAYVDKLRTDNRCERTIIGILDLKKDMAKFSKRSKKRTIDQLDILFIQEYKKYLRTVRRNADNYD